MTTNQFFEKAIIEATNAGNIAGKQWIVDRIQGKYLFNEEKNRITDFNGNVVNPMLDCCGGAYIELKDGRTKFAKYLKNTSKNRQVWSVDIPHRYRGWQDMGLKEAIIKAAYKVLTETYDIKGIRYKSYID